MKYPAIPNRRTASQPAIFLTWAVVLFLASCVPTSESKQPAHAEQQSTPLIASNTTSGAALQRFTYREPHLGTHAGLVFYAPNNDVANRASIAAYTRIRELDAVFSSYREDSEISRLCKNIEPSKEIPVSPGLWQVLVAAQALSHESNGAFDVTVGPASRLWKRAIRQKKLPSEERISQAQQAVGYEYLELIGNPIGSTDRPTEKTDDDSARVRLTRPNMRLDLAAIAKGYIADATLAELNRHGCESALVDLGGDLAIGAAPPGTPGWKIGIANGNPIFVSHDRSADAGSEEIVPPITAKGRRTMTLANCGLATSGDAFQHIAIENKRYAHIVDPRTCIGTSESLTVTVIAPTAMLADGLASTVVVLGREAGLEFIRKNPIAAKAEVSILPPSHSANAAQRLETDGFPRNERDTKSQ